MSSGALVYTELYDACSACRRSFAHAILSSPGTSERHSACVPELSSHRNSALRAVARACASSGVPVDDGVSGPTSWDGSARAAIAEDIVGMTNIRDGGLIVIGVSEGSDGNLCIDGLGPEQAKSFDPTKVIDFVASCFQPLVKLRVERPVVDGKQLVALRVEEFDQTPVICVKDGPVKDERTGKRQFYEGNVIVRSPAAKTVVIRTAEDMHALIRLAVTKTSNRLLEDMRRLLEGRGESQPISTQPYERDIAIWANSLAERVNGWKQTHPGRGFFSFLLLPDKSLESTLEHAEMKKVVVRLCGEFEVMTYKNSASHRVLNGIGLRRSHSPEQRG